METTNAIDIKECLWKIWTHKSQNIPFKTIMKGVGDGEQKVAHELDTHIRGQNSDYDMRIVIKEIEYECDIKKLDNNTFNTGVKGRNALRPIKTKITNLLNSFRKIVDSPILTEEEKTLLNDLEEVSPDELCVSNIKKIYKNCEILHKKREEMILTLPNVKPFITNDGNIIEMNLLDYYNICLIIKKDIMTEYKNYEEILIFLSNISTEYIINPEKLYSELNNLVSIFSNLKLIFVDEIKGYYILDDITKIKFERITRGNPRFRVFI